MDLRLGLAGPPTDGEKAAVDSVLGDPESGWDGGTRTQRDGHMAVGGHQARGRRHLLLPTLESLQERTGWVSPSGLDYLCTRLTVPPAEAYGVAAFYSLLRTDPSPPTVVHVCDDVVCLSQGAEDLCREMEARFGAEGRLDPETGVGWTRSPCLGRCEQGSAALLQRSSGPNGRTSLAPASADAIAALLGGTDPEWLPAAPVRTPPEQRRLLRRVGRVDPASLDSYRAWGGYQALRAALRMGPSAVVEELKRARLMGRGGAAFPTGAKWEAVAANPLRPHFFVCNADESEPGTFKDRVLLEQDPFAVLEALTIAGLATGSERGYVYIRGEYPEAAAGVARAVAEARRHGFLGPSVMGSDFNFEVEVREGAGAYIAGEETALFNSIEGKRPEPRNKPPFPTQAGLFGRPTGINNVETLVNVLEILTLGGEGYAQLGTSGSTGTRLFCVSGCVQAPGLYELEFGATLAQLLELAGGVPPGRSLRAVLLGGAAGSFVGPQDLGIRLTFEDTRAIGASLGSGVVLVLDDTVDLGAILRRLARFFRDESCGQCVPCRVGTVRQEELVARLSAGRTIGSVQAELQLLREIGAAMRDSSICGLGQTAATAIESAVRLGLLGGLEGSV
ncbi:MAG: NAD(P)H-dependent oxidoreductase subunit E [Candidatus Dormibacteria bacterium]